MASVTTLLPDTAVVTETTEENVCASIWNYKSGVLLKSYKGGACERDGIAFQGSDYLWCTQLGKQTIHVWDVDKEQIHKTYVCPAKASCLCFTSHGTYCIVAVAEKIYIWQTCNGALMKVLSKHYQNITCLKLIDGDSHFISTGGDNLVLVWDLASVLQPDYGESSLHGNCEPLYTWSHHSMPVGSIYVGIGGIRCRVLTCSKDQTCRLYEFSTGNLIATFVFDVPLTASTMDASEARLFAGASTGGIHLVNLFSQTFSSDIHVTSEKGKTFSGHSNEITALSVNIDGTMLISGSLDASCRVWDIRSRQCLRILTQKGPVTNAFFQPTLPSLLGSASPAVRLQLPAKLKRTLFTPGPANKDSDELSAGDDVITLRLHHIDAANRYPCAIEGMPSAMSELQSTLSLIEQVKAEHRVRGHRSAAAEVATVPELRARVAELEEANRKLYELVRDKIVAELDGKST